MLCIIYIDAVEGRVFHAANKDIYVYNMRCGGLHGRYKPHWIKENLSNNLNSGS